MALLKSLARQSTRTSMFLNLQPTIINCIDKRTKATTENENQWMKKKSEETMQRVRRELGPDLKIDKTQPQLFFEDSDELTTANDTVKKILSLEYARKVDYKRYENNLIKKIVQKMSIEENSLEIDIAYHTLNIRRMVANQEEFKGRNKQVEFFLYRQIHRRDNLMRELFYKNNKRYEWLKETLNMRDYQLVEKYDYVRQTRYDKHISEVKRATREMRVRKVEQLKEEFVKQKKIFFKERDAILDQIRKDLADLNSISSESHSNKNAQK